MKTDKALALAALVAVGLFAGSTLHAQNSTNAPAAASVHGHPDFATALNLTDDQKPKFKEIMQSAMTQRKALRTDSSLSAEDKKAKAKAIQEDMSTQMKALLTDEQFTKWQTMMKGMRQRPGTNAGGEAKPSAPPQQ